MFEAIEAVLLAVLFGGMVTFQLLFAPLVFIKIDIGIARPFIRAFFPWYYLYFGLLALLLTGISYFTENGLLHIVSAASLVGFIISRQVLMPLANRATDNGDTKGFKIYHMTTVAINTLQLLGFVVVYFSNLILVN
ncbi:MAG: hypothetical protein GJ671_01680 [Alteromonadaceae bacterium]|nr:hypothetical protein [Alteromonadaceae bacterium]